MNPEKGDDGEGQYAADIPENKREKLEGQLVDEGKEAIRPAARECWAETLEEFPEATGQVNVQFVIERREDRGRVSITEIGDESTLYESKLHDCLTDEMFELEFDDFEPDRPVEGTFAFVFQEKRGAPGR